MKRKALNDPLINVPPSKLKSRKQKYAAESSTKVTEKGRKRTIKDFLREKDSQQKDSQENEDEMEMKTKNFLLPFAKSVTKNMTTQSKIVHCSTVPAARNGSVQYVLY